MKPGSIYPVPISATPRVVYWCTSLLQAILAVPSPMGNGNFFLFGRTEHSIYFQHNYMNLTLVFATVGSIQGQRPHQYGKPCPGSRHDEPARPKRTAAVACPYEIG